MSGLVIILILWAITWSAISAASIAGQKWLLDNFDLDKKRWQSWIYVALISAVSAAVILYALNINILNIYSTFVRQTA